MRMSSLVGIHAAEKPTEAVMVRIKDFMVSGIELEVAWMITVLFIYRFKEEPLVDLSPGWRKC